MGASIIALGLFSSILDLKRKPNPMRPNFFTIQIVSLFLFSANIYAQSTTYTVDDDGGGDFLTIEAALAAASSGDVIVITGGADNIHTEANQFVEQDITIRGQGAGTTILQSGPAPQTLFRDRGLFSINGDVTIEDMTIRYGFFEVGGALAIFTGTVTLNNVIIRECTAFQGGAIYVEEPAILNLNQCQIIDNGVGLVTPFSGGGIYVGGVANITESVIANNTVTEFGGGLSFNSFDLPAALSTISNSTISNNTSTEGYGAGIYTDHPLDIQNSTVSTNIATLDGGGIYTSATGILSLQHVTVANNSTAANGGGVFVAPFDGSSAGILNTVNSLIGDNSATDAGADVFLDGNLITNIQTLVEDCAGSACTSTTFPINGDPNLSPLQDNGGFTFTHALASPSAALNRANPANSLPLDQIGQTRADCPDLGAFELPGISETSVIRLTGGGGFIPNGSTTPSIGNNTDFGEVFLGGEQILNFSISNLGCATLELTGTGPVSFVGGSSAFSVETQPNNAIGSFQGDDFQIKFEPTSLGFFTATVRIFNNDADENPFTFTIQGQGVGPEIEIRGNGIPIGNGNTATDPADGTDFGSVDLNGAQVTNTFEIVNLGDRPLLLNGNPVINFLGSSGGFTVIGSPATTNIPAGGSAEFQIEFDPSTEGSQSATVSIENNDSNEGFYTFVISGSGGGSPQIVVSGNGENIANNDLTPSFADNTNFGTVEIGNSLDRQFVITNNGQETLLVTNINPGSGFPNSAFSIIGPSSFFIAPGFSNTFTVRFAPTENGVQNTNITILNNDVAFRFAVQGQSSAPEINVLGPTDEPIRDGDSSPSDIDGTDFGTVELNSGSIVRTFTIENQGGEPLQLLGSPRVVVFNTGAPAFSVSRQPASPNIPADGGFTTFDITFNPLATGSLNGTIQILSNDGDENPYVFSIRGFVGASPDIAVIGNGNNISNGDDFPTSENLTNFGAVAKGQVTTRFQLVNEGTADLFIQNAVVQPLGNISAFSLNNNLANVRLRPGRTKNLTVAFDPPSAGKFEANIIINNNDADEDPFIFRVTGLGLCQSGPREPYFHWTNESGDNQWSNSLNWRTDQGLQEVPDAGAIVYFGCDINDDCNIDTNPSVARFIINDDYSGMISLGSNQLTISEELRIDGADSFDAGDGTVELANTTGEIEVESSAPVHNLSLSADILDLKAPLVVAGDLTINDLEEFNGSRLLQLEGDLQANNSALYVGKGVIQLMGDTDQRLRGNGLVSNIDISKPSGSVVLENTFRLSNGALTGDGSLTGNALLIDDDYEFDFAGTLTDLILTAGDIKLDRNLELTGDLVVSSLNRLTKNELQVRGNIICNEQNLAGNGSLVMIGNENSTFGGNTTVRVDLNFIIRKEALAMVDLTTRPLFRKLYVESGLLDLSGQSISGKTFVQANGGLTGVGQLNDRTIVDAGGQIIPGNGMDNLGVLAFELLRLSSDAEILLDVDGNDSDQVTFATRIDITDSRLLLTAGNNPTIPLTLIRSVINRRISGSFANAQDGDAFDLNGESFIVNYSDGQRNIVLSPAASQLRKPVPEEVAGPVQLSGLNPHANFEVVPPTWKFYPNPVGDQLVLQTQIPLETAPIRIFNNLGKLVLQKQVLGPGTTIDVSKLPAGIYILNYHRESKTFVKKDF